MQIEMPFVGFYEDEDQDVKINYKGKPDMFIVDRSHKTIEAFDYKTSRPFDPSGYDWGMDIHGKRHRMSVE